VPAILLQPLTQATAGDTLRAWVLVSDVDGTPAAADTVTLAAALPDGTTDTGTVTAQTRVGLYEATYDLTQAGATTVTITVTSADFGDDVITAVIGVRATTGAPPDASAVHAYLGDTSATDEEIADALASEQAAQAARCTIPADYPEDLAQALKRRVARNLAARAVPVASYTSFEGGTTAVRVPRIDAEIARLEAPYLRLPVG
jgi:hypothetical protein